MSTKSHWLTMALLLAVATLNAATATQVITVENGYTLFVGQKEGVTTATNPSGMTHYVPLNEVTPDNVESSGTNQVYTFTLNDGEDYTYRVSKSGKRDVVGFFHFNADPTKQPDLTFSAANMPSDAPIWLDHSITGRNVADIFININAQGFLRMQTGDERDVFAQRNWQLINTDIANYFLEPTYHYAVYDLNGALSSKVVTIDRTTTDQNPWVRLRAVGKGTAIVTVTYDALTIRNFNASTLQYSDGNYSAIWPENTAVFVVSVDEDKADIEPNMWLNPNSTNEKLSGDTIDAEHDVLYYVTNEGQQTAAYTFTPKGVSKVELKRPTVGTNTVSYTNTWRAVNANTDGSYTLSLPEGRSIVRLTDSNGRTAYQVLTAKPCTRTYSNLTNPDHPVRPGDQVKVQYAGLFHPANKMAAIYNMSAYIAYNGVAEGTTAVGTPAQYTFASTPSAQAYTFTVPADYDISKGDYRITGGCIRVTGFGSPMGDHRYIDKNVGRQANLNAVTHNTDCGHLPDFAVPVVAIAHHKVVFADVPQSATIVVRNAEDAVLPQQADGSYDVLYGTFTYTVSGDYLTPLTSSFTVSESMPTVVKVQTGVQYLGETTVWDGQSTAEPKKDDEGYYLVSTAAELAWVATMVNTDNENYGAINVRLQNDINLASFLWMGIGTSSSVTYNGVFDGQNHTVRGLYVNATETYKGLFSSITNQVRNLTVEGLVESSSQLFAGVTAGVNGGRLENCHFRGRVVAINPPANITTTTRQHVGGVAAFLTGSNAAIVGCSNEGYIYGYASVAGVVACVANNTAIIQDCYNWGSVSGTARVGGIVAGNTQSTSNITNAGINRLYNIGTLIMRYVENYPGQLTKQTTIGAICSQQIVNLKDAYASAEYTQKDGVTFRALTDFAKGEVAHLLAAQMGQQLSSDPYPVYAGAPLYRVTQKSNQSAAVVDTLAAGDYTFFAPDIAGYAFQEWQSDRKTVSTDNPYTVTLSADLSLTAIYRTDMMQYAVKVKMDEAYGTYTGEGEYQAGEKVTVKATVAKGYYFLGWRNEEGTLLTTNSSYTFTVDADYTLVADVVRAVTLTFSNGKEAYNYGDYRGEGTYPIGAEVELRMVEMWEEAYFVGWGSKAFVDLPQAEDGLVRQSIFRFVITDDTEVEVVVKSKGGIQLTIEDSGWEDYATIIGMGNYKREVGTVITLTAVPFDGWAFKEWYDEVGGEMFSQAIWTLEITKDNIDDVPSELSFEPHITRSDVQLYVASLPEWGEFTNNSYQSLKYNTYSYLTAQPAKGYTFLGWVIADELGVDLKDEKALQEVMEDIASNEKIQSEFKDNGWLLTDNPLIVSMDELNKRSNGRLEGEGELTLLPILQKGGTTVVIDGWRSEWGTLHPIHLKTGSEVEFTEAEKKGNQFTYYAGEPVLLFVEMNKGYNFTYFKDSKDILGAKNQIIELGGNSEFYAELKDFDEDLVLIPYVESENDKYIEVSLSYKAAWGTFTGAGLYLAGELVRIDYSLNDGLVVTGWTIVGEGGEDYIEGAEFYFPYTDKMGSMTVEPVVEEAFKVSIGEMKEPIGSFDGVGYYAAGSKVTITPTLPQGYYVAYWEVYVDGKNTGEFDTKDPVFTMEMVKGDVVLIPYVEKEEQVASYRLALSYQPSWGTFEGAGYYKEGSKATIKYDLNKGYEVKGWNIVGQDKDYLKGDEFSYEMNGKMGNITVTPDVVRVVAITATCDAQQGSVVGGGTVAAGTEVTLTATAKEGYQFKAWSNGWTEQQLVLTANYDLVLTAEFLPLYTITFVDGETTLYTTVVAEGERPVYNGEAVEKDADAEYTYTFLGWDKTLVPAMGDATYTASYSTTKNRYLLTLTVQSTDCGVILGAEEGEYEYGTILTLKAVANSGYRFVKWADNDETSEVREVVITGDIELTAIFELDLLTGIEEVVPTSAPQKLWQEGSVIIVLPDGKHYDINGHLLN